MSLVLWRTYTKSKNNKLLCRSTNKVLSCSVYNFLARKYSDDQFINNADYSSSTILVENGYNVQELPVIVRKLKDVTGIKEDTAPDTPRSASDSLSYHLIQAEFKECMDLRDVFTLITKCTKITPNIALGAIERIYDLEKNPSTMLVDPSSIHINFAKGAILDKLLRVVMKTEDTQTILNVMKTESSVMEPYKHRFCDELLIRVTDNKLSVDQLCEFALFLIKNNIDTKYCQTIDKLWVGFVEREGDINEKNIVHVFTVLPGLKASKRMILALLEQKLSELWPKIGVTAMQDILAVFIHEKYFSLQSFAVLGRWLNTNIHNLDEDSLLDIVSKLTRLKYTDDQVETAIEKYMKLKGLRVESHVLIVGILNYCLHFQIRNEQILDMCSKYFMINGPNIPHSFLKSFIYPIGYLDFGPSSGSKFWKLAEDIIVEKFDKINADDLCSIILSFIYKEQYPLKVVTRVYTAEYLSKITNSNVLKNLHLIDTVMTLECQEHAGPLLPKDQCCKPIVHDRRIRNIVDKIWDSFVAVIGSKDKVSAGVLVPNYCSDDTYLIDVLVHPTGFANKTYNWMSQVVKDENVAVLVHLPDHYCSNSERLIGSQLMKKRQLKMLGLKVASLKYSMLSQFYTSYNNDALKAYLKESIENAEPCQ
ncbi:FAST kinase domain-containing protein 3, mitochondrial-like [Epargyreus clarus]|uniref:FAST kinase domain-containing protein 3, mitochondrial-like n=1 Tax=Epargyreus clarus TaxID=520877 RepID=UPI003C2DA450